MSVFESFRTCSLLYLTLFMSTSCLLVSHSVHIRLYLSLYMTVCICVLFCSGLSASHSFHVCISVHLCLLKYIFIVDLNSTRKSVIVSIHYMYSLSLYSSSVLICLGHSRCFIVNISRMVRTILIVALT